MNRMRSSLSALALTLGLGVAAYAPATAEACGGYGVQVPDDGWFEANRAVYEDLERRGRSAQVLDVEVTMEGPVGRARVALVHDGVRLQQDLRLRRDRSGAFRVVRRSALRRV